MESKHKNIAEAFFAAQRNMRDAVKGKDNPFFKSKYADLNSVREAVTEPLMNEDISISQPEVVIDGKNYVRTILTHVTSGTEMHSDVEIVMAQANNPQAQGSSITYARRYGLQSICGIGAADDDGNGASRPVQSQNDMDREIAENDVLLAVKICKTVDEINAVYKGKRGVFKNQSRLIEACAARKKEISA
jgi:hypothetical protein